MKSSYDFSQGTRGPVVPIPEGKEKITIRLDTDIVEWFRSLVDKAGGGNYQTLMNKALREYIEGRSPRLEDTLRRVIREEVLGKPKRRVRQPAL